jgi:hypothetical protein
LVPKKACSFQPKEPTFSRVQRAVAKQSDFGLVWIVQVKDQKICPLGIGLTLKKLLVVDRGQRFTPAVN